ncbi:MAG TPA: S8 family serine peptidase, partial [Polyangiaceae bacterium LLY-WYZ-15_(1-7)]|nr:S8 family serine peptidase [Polyangiaceae bacterium LLY-WYZ-15_(1-7)]
DPWGITDPSGQPFCLYEWTGVGAPTLATLPSDPGTGAAGVSWTDADCLGVVPLGSTDPLEYVWQDHAAAYERQVGAPRYLPEGRGIPQRVHVAILDSSADSDPHELEPTTGEYLHGRAISQVIRRSTCPRGREDVCIPDFDTQLVLDQGGDDGTEGGHYGSIARLAQALEQAVFDGGERTIIPLAVGWHPRYQHRDGDPLAPEAQTVAAVRAALDWATCSGALVLAAAGNQTSSADGAGALYPAAWESTPSSCNLERPIVYAAGAVGWDGEPIGLTRDGGMARLQGYGEAVSADNRIEVKRTRTSFWGGGSIGTLRPRAEPTDELLGIWTGTSMGVASVAAAATLVWGYRPDLSNHDVADWLFWAGETMDQRADLCPWNGNAGELCPQARRVTACGALQSVLASACPSCEVPCAAGMGRAEPSAEVLDRLLSLGKEQGLVAEGVELSTPIVGSSCSAPVYGDSGYEPSRAYCPWEAGESWTAAPERLDPQPGPNGCGVCALFGQGTKGDLVYLSILDDFRGTLEEPTLVIPNYGNIALADAMNEPMLTGGDIAAVPLPWSSASYPPDTKIAFIYRESPNHVGQVVSTTLPFYP